MTANLPFFLYQCQTLGKAAVYSQLRNVGDISTRLLSIIKHKVPVTSVTRASDVLILNLLHRVSLVYP